MDINIIKSNRKTISIQVNPDLSVTVRAPRRATNKEIMRIVHDKEDWINKSIEKIKARQEDDASQEIDYLSAEEIHELVKKAKNYIPARVEYFANLMGISYGRIAIRNQKTRWGSCSSKGNLNFNCLLMLTPDEVIDYVVVHELCHRKQMNHSQAFWKEVSSVIPNYKEYVKWLKTEGHVIMRRVK